MMWDSIANATGTRNEETVPLIEGATRILFFTGKGGVGKTSIACAVAMALADRGRRVLLVSTDPASNLDEVLGASLSAVPSAIPGAAGLFALNIDPEAAAREYRNRVVGPYRGVLPDAAIASMEEQLSGACTVEIAAFDEFSKLLGDAEATAGFDHLIFDTAPTGHTLRLLKLPLAWSGYIATSGGDVSCLGPLSGLQAQQTLYEASVQTLSDPAITTFVIVSRPDRPALSEAERARNELAGVVSSRHHLVLNGLFVAGDGDDTVAIALEERGRLALEEMPSGLMGLPRTEIPLFPFALMGADCLRAVFSTEPEKGDVPLPSPICLPWPGSSELGELIDEVAEQGHGVVMAMGKGGVGKTTVAAAIAVELAHRGHRVLLTTTDPAAHIAVAVGDVEGVTVSRIDPVAETREYVEEVIRTAGKDLDAEGLALLEENLRSPCTEEVAVFRAFARTVARGLDAFVVVDTAPTGHTLLLLDAAEAYHREVSRTMSDAPDEVRNLLPRLRDPNFARMVLVTLPEATPVHEAARLQADLLRAGITPFAWVINQSFAASRPTDAVLVQRGARELSFIEEVRSRYARRYAVLPWMPEAPVGAQGLRSLMFGDRLGAVDA
jgi:arsenite/tail-anchored protein-transporting ATPase